MQRPAGSVLACGARYSTRTGRVSAPAPALRGAGPRDVVEVGARFFRLLLDDVVRAVRRAVGVGGVEQLERVREDRERRPVVRGVDAEGLVLELDGADVVRDAIDQFDGGRAA